MPTEEEEAKILLCGALINYHSAESACASAEAMREMVNLVRVTLPDLDRKAKRYYDEVDRRARAIMKEARAVMEAAEAFKADD